MVDARVGDALPRVCPTPGMTGVKRERASPRGEIWRSVDYDEHCTVLVAIEDLPKCLCFALKLTYPSVRENETGHASLMVRFRRARNAVTHQIWINTNCGANTNTSFAPPSQHLRPSFTLGRCTRSRARQTRFPIILTQ